MYAHFLGKPDPNYDFNGNTHTSAFFLFTNQSAHDTI